MWVMCHLERKFNFNLEFVKQKNWLKKKFRNKKRKKKLIC
jgi:hypothetical protein